MSEHDGYAEDFDDHPVYWWCEDGETTCNGETEARVGQIEVNTRIEYKHYENVDGDLKTSWIMNQDGKMLPETENDWNDCSWGDYWYNYWTELAHNWYKGDLTDLDCVDYAPSSDATSQINTSYGVSVPAGLSMSVSVNHPPVERNVNYNTPPDERVEAVYDFEGYGAEDDNVLLSQLSGWKSDRPSSGDDVAPGYYYGAFQGDNCDDTIRLLEYQSDASLWKMYNMSEFVSV